MAGFTDTDAVARKMEAETSKKIEWNQMKKERKRKNKNQNKKKDPVVTAPAIVESIGQTADVASSSALRRAVAAVGPE